MKNYNSIGYSSYQIQAFYHVSEVLMICFTILFFLHSITWIEPILNSKIVPSGMCGQVVSLKYSEVYTKFLSVSINLQCITSQKTVCFTVPYIITRHTFEESLISTNNTQIFIKYPVISLVL